MKQSASENTATIGSTEYFLASNSTSQTPQTTVGEIQAFIDFSALQAGDRYEIRHYAKVVSGGTQRLVSYQIVDGVQSLLYYGPVLKVRNGWEVSLKKVAGTDRSIAWSIRQDVEGETVIAGSISNNAITAAAINSGAITAAKFAASAIDSTVLADNAIAAAKIAANAITAAKIATDAIGAAQIATDAVTEIQNGLAVAATITTQLTGVLDEIDNTAFDTQTAVTDAQAAILAKLPATLVGGRIDASVGAVATDALTADALAADAVAEIQSGLAQETSVTTLGLGIVDLQARLPATLDGGLMRSQVKGIDANQVNASALAADAVAEIQSGLASGSALATLQTSVDDLPTNAELATALAAADDAVLAAVANVQADTDDIQSRLPAMLVGGKMDSSATVDSLDPDSINAITDAIAGTILDVEFETGRTLRGFLTRGDAVFKGEASGLNGPTARFKNDAGDVVIECDQDISLGTREAATIADGD